MYFSRKLQLLFIACPKTGSMSIEDSLMKLNPAGELHSITYNNKQITSKDMYYGVIGHARAWEIKKALGNESYNQLHVLGMVRHPLDKLISAYYYYKSLRILNVLRLKGKKNLFMRKVSGIISYTAPKLLPFSIWALLYPMKTNYDFYFDKNGERIVKHLGRTDYLGEDLKLILKRIGITENVEITHINKSKHKSRDYYFKNKWIKNILLKKYAKDIELYQIAEKEMSIID